MIEYLGRKRFCDFESYINIFVYDFEFIVVILVGFRYFVLLEVIE